MAQTLFSSASALAARPLAAAGLGWSLTSARVELNDTTSSPARAGAAGRARRAARRRPTYSYSPSCEAAASGAAAAMPSAPAAKASRPAAFDVPAPELPKNSNPILDGNYGPVRHELTLGPEDLEVIGRIPEEIRGCFIRNGPNPQFEPEGTHHWFEGDGMLHSVRLENGSASYRNRYVRTPVFRKEEERGRAIVGGLAGPPGPGTLATVARNLIEAGVVFKNTGNTNVLYHNKRLLALWEGGDPTQMRVDDLSTVGTFNFGGALKHPFSAHPKIDPESGELINFGYSTSSPDIGYSVWSREGRLVHTSNFRLPVGVMMHDFAITKKYTIFMDLPLTLRFERILKGEFIYGFEPDRPARFGILPRYGDARRDMIWVEAPAFYVFHVLNAYDDGDDVVLDAGRFTGIDIFGGGAASGSRPKGWNEERMHRWRIDVKARRIVEDRPLGDTERTCGFQRMNERLAGRRHRYGYAVSSNGMLGDGQGNSLLKYDTETGRVTEHPYGLGRTSSEAVFIPRPGATEEDDGWLASYVFDAAERRSELVLLDARDMEAEAAARVRLPARVPHGFHAQFVDLSS
eukprot:tig00000949_g5736.t1